MSVIVKGMKMPDCCASCPFLEYDDYATGKEHHCNALDVAMSWDDLPEGRRKDCPLAELIQCKDCKHHGEQYGNGYCMKDGCYGWSDEDYCSRAERKPPQVNPEMVKALKDRIEKQRGKE